MEKTIYDESNGLWYELRGDYYIPCLTVRAQAERPIGIWGQRHLQYIRQHRKALYTELLTGGRLNTSCRKGHQHRCAEVAEPVQKDGQPDGAIEKLLVEDSKKRGLRRDQSKYQQMKTQIRDDLNEHDIMDHRKYSSLNDNSRRFSQPFYQALAEKASE